MEYYRRFAAGEEIVEGDFGEFQKEMCVQISFFQHERLIHLIVTVLFAVLAVVSILVNLFIQELAQDSRGTSIRRGDYRGSL